MAMWKGTITKTNGVESAGGKLVVEIKGTAKQEWQTVVVVVPVVIKVKGTAGTKADFSVGFDFNKSKVYTKGKVELTLPSVRLIRRYRCFLYCRYFCLWRSKEPCYSRIRREG